MQKSSPPRKTVWIALAVVIIAVVVSGSATVGLYASRLTNTPGNTNGISPVAQQMTISQAVQAFKNYLGSLQNSNIALHEVEEYQYNFYASYYEKNTGTFAFQMLIWKQGSGYMMGMMNYAGSTGVAVPEMGPNMMWNTKYGMMNGGMMGGGMMGSYSHGASGPMTITTDQASTIAQQYLDKGLPIKTAGDADTFYGYYNIDVMSNGSPFGMLSVNGYTGQVWYHSWHGTYVQTVTID